MIGFSFGFPVGSLNVFLIGASISFLFGFPIGFLTDFPISFRIGFMIGSPISSPTAACAAPHSRPTGSAWQGGGSPSLL